MLETAGQNTREIMLSAYRAKTVIPAFNIPYLPMIEPIINALKDTGTFGLIQVARLEWVKFESKSLEAVAREYTTYASDTHTRLHLDHVPVVDEDGWFVDYLDILRKALDLGYQSLMIDGSRLDLEENIKTTSFACTIAHDGGVPIEAELGAVLGHESGPLPPYEELFESGKGFTDVGQAKRFAKVTGVDWLSVAIGNIHGAVSGVLKNEKKVAARLDINRLKAINEVVEIPLVLHGGSGIHPNYIQEAIQNGIAKINIGTNLRQAYEKAFTQTASVVKAQNAVYEKVKDIVINELKQQPVIS
jgi:fructose-bisphosphate aldolase, class II